MFCLQVQIDLCLGNNLGLRLPENPRIRCVGGTTVKILINIKSAD